MNSESSVSNAADRTPDRTPVPARAPDRASPLTQAPARVTVVIPARGGSVSVPLKNLQRVGGQTLIGRAVRAASAARLVTDVVVSTDHPAIAGAARLAGARVIDRPASLASNTAGSEETVLHALDATGPDPVVTVLMQCTSPFIDPDDLDRAIARVLDGEADVAFSAAASHSFLWTVPDGTAQALGHDAAVRPRRQDRAPQYRETGAFYAMDTAGLRAGGHRFFGRLALVLVAEEHAMEIDSPTDLDVARALCDRDATVTPAGPQTGPGDGSNTAPDPLDVDALVTDFDGVHTDDHAWVDADGTEFVRVSRGDGLGVSRLRRAGIRQLILSTETNTVVTARAAKLGLDVWQGITDKAAAIVRWMETEGLDPQRVAFVGNDINDLPAMARVGWPVAVADARPAVADAARLVLHTRGGEGAVRETCERILASGDSTVSARPSTRKEGTQMSTTAQTATTGTVNIGDVPVGDGHPVYVIGEIGINHNGDVEIAKQLIDVAAAAGAQAVKLQKRTPEISTPDDMKNKLRATPWGEMTYLDYKRRIEFGSAEYEKIGRHAANLGLHCFASPWDVPSVEFMEQAGAVAHKVASASVTDTDLLHALADTGKPIILSTGMSTLSQIDDAVNILGTSNLVMLHATSTYPLPPEEANLRMIETLRERYGVPVGYSGHERGLQISVAAVALGAVAVERHITLDRTMWGSDQASSLEPAGFENLIRDIRILEDAMGDGVKRIFDGELAPLSRLRRVGA